MKKSLKAILIISLAIILIFLTFFYFLNKSKIVSVKYGEEVDIKNFEYLDTSKSSFVNGAWYDSWNDKMVIKLNDTYYQYCYISEKVWDSFTKDESFGSFFNSNIKGKYDCLKNSEFNKKMATKWEKCWPFGGAEWADIEKSLKSQGWKDLSGLWSDPDGNYIPEEELEVKEELSLALEEALKSAGWKDLTGLWSDPSGNYLVEEELEDREEISEALDVAFEKCMYGY